MIAWLKRFFHTPTPEEQYAKGGWLVHNTLSRVGAPGSMEELAEASNLYSHTEAAMNESAAERAFDRGVIEALMIHGYYSDSRDRFDYHRKDDKRFSRKPVRIHPSLMRYSEKDAMRNNHERRTR